MAKFILHIDKANGEMKTSKRSLEQDEVIPQLQSILFRMALGEYTGVYVTIEDALGLLEKQNDDRRTAEKDA